ncbi:MAG: ABC-F family ATP-binding cassette domain-containing protein [Butyrivibrio sp.]|nr:ABC-F family ATP-binding cassette domain-containing protein [Butyrivibrio sp.]
MILNCSNINKAFAGSTVLKDVSFHIEDGEKAAVVGINGAGKSTLLKIIINELSPDSGAVTLSRDKTIGYLAQHQDISSVRTVYEEVLTVKRDVMELELSLRSLEQQMKSASGEALEGLLEEYAGKSHEFERQNGYAVRSEVTGVLKGLGFAEEEFDKPICRLSGGEKTRVSLSRLLLSRPDLLLLDEPTNHLDLPSIAWLESFLHGYDGSVLIVSHDRYFLDKIVTKVIELENGSAYAFRGNYSDYASKKAMLREAKLKAYYNNRREIKRQQEVIDKLKSFNREKSIKRAESREKLLSKMEIVEKPANEADAMHFKLEPSVVSGNDVLSVSGLSKSFGSRVLFENIAFEIKRGERVALLGANGTGKTTILRIINGLADADCGELRLGAGTECGYYDQEQQALDTEKTLFDEISDAYPDMTNTRIRNVLAAFLFTGDDVFKKIGELSGGERGRMLLAKLMLSNANFLLLDEPTNHLDMASKEILESALNSYTGTCLFVSHDRYFINSVATRILDLRGGTLTAYAGGYEYYLEKSSPLSVGIKRSAAASAADVPSPSSSKEERLRQKEEQAKERKRLGEIARAEARIAQIDDELAEIDGSLALEEVYTNPSKLAELSGRRKELADEQEQLYELWERLENAE